MIDEKYMEQLHIKSCKRRFDFMGTASSFLNSKFIKISFIVILIQAEYKD